MVQNKALIFKKVPVRNPLVNEHLAIEARELDLDLLKARNVAAGNGDGDGDGVVIVRGLYFSLDPYMRGRMRDAAKKSYVDAFVVDMPVPAFGVVQVVSVPASSASTGGEREVNGKNSLLEVEVGDIVSGLFDIAEYSVVPRAAWKFQAASNPLMQKIVPAAAGAGAAWSPPLANNLSILGMTGLTAYSSLYEIGTPKAGETIVVSSAAGAVGQIVGQIAKREGLKVFGSVGDDAKLKFIVDELGFDGGWNYKNSNETPLQAMRRLAPQGVDIYYDNVGGEQLDAALEAMNVGGRIVACGMISQYNLPPDEKYPIKNLGQIVPKAIRMQGFIVNYPNFGPKYLVEFREKISKWLAEGSIKSKEHIDYGIDSAASAFVAMLEGKNFGKAIVKVADPE